MTPQIKKMIEDAAEKYSNDIFKLNPDGMTVAPYCNSEMFAESFEIGATMMHDKLMKVIEMQREALEFYSKQKHFEWCGTDEFEPETVSGEPQNYECGGDEGSEFTLENGGIARQCLEQTDKMLRGN